MKSSEYKGNNAKPLIPAGQHLKAVLKSYVITVKQALAY
jgi:hypothetical protein